MVQSLGLAGLLLPLLALGGCRPDGGGTGGRAERGRLYYVRAERILYPAGTETEAACAELLAPAIVADAPQGDLRAWRLPAVARADFLTTLALQERAGRLRRFTDELYVSGGRKGVLRTRLPDETAAGATEVGFFILPEAAPRRDGATCFRLAPFAAAADGTRRELAPAGGLVALAPGEGLVLEAAGGGAAGSEILAAPAGARRLLVVWIEPER